MLKRGDLVKQNALLFDDLYERGKLIGSGGFGSVYRCTHRAARVDVAAKFVPAGETGSPPQSERFLASELPALTRIDHPDIARLLEWFEEDGHYILVFQLCDGGDLHSFMQKQKDLDPRDRICDMQVGRMARQMLKVGRMARQMLKALSGCHARNIVHMDVKPDNFIFASPQPEAPLKMIDLGVATLDSMEGSTVGGTRGYMSPEVSGGENFDGRADVYAVGCIVFELLLDEPFFTEGEMHVSKGLLTRRLSQTRAEERLLPEAIDFLKATLAYEQGDRLTSSGALQHPFVQRGSRASYCSDAALRSAAEESLSRIRSFVNMPAMRRLAYSIIARFTPDRDLQESRSLFRHVDTDGDGIISFSELSSFLEDYSDITRSEREKLLQSLGECFGNTEGDGCMYYEQFLAATLSPDVYLLSQQARFAWQAINLGGRTTVGARELLRLLPSRHDAEIHGLVAEVTDDVEGSISFELFERIMRQCGLIELSSASLFERQCDAVDTHAAAVLQESMVRDAVETAVRDCQFCVTIADPTASGAPLIAVSKGFEEMTGFTREEILGTNCRFLNRDCHLEPSDIEDLRHACRTGAPFTGILQNRKKSGEHFLNLLDLRGMVVAQNPNTGSEMWFLVGIQADVTKALRSDMPDNHLARLQEVADLIRTQIADRLSLLAISGALAAKSGGDQGAAALRQAGAAPADWLLLAAPRLRQ